MKKELAKQYDPKNVEDRIYKSWLEGKYFHAKREAGKETYTIVIPPPNITGQLHMGHALDNTLQDFLIRWKRMSGYDTLWLPGTDHASIATESKIVEAMRKEGITKEDLGREKILERAWEWKAQYGGRIVEQLKKMGSSCDWYIEIAVSVITEAARIYIPLNELVDFEAEKARLNKELEAVKKDLEFVENKLNNPGFMAKAPEKVVAAQRESQEKYKAKIQMLQESLSKLQ